MKFPRRHLNMFGKCDKCGEDDWILTDMQNGHGMCRTCRAMCPVK